MEERAAQPQPAFSELTLIAIAGVNIAHDLIRKPVPIPDQVEDRLFGIMRSGDGGS